ncbi:FMRFamide receptor [Eurytemora carolleeae]|uniref:FMRFamide receptor n=1 Tax=Eurytemora carolleeae TaxID=1294199 RepID=UPI000C78D871|nr:FMRFamide receptor [Eurytemora carolleeae]|eukprot:XP_023347490.1 FMRFamide receptor-like [Eurytemora affinis]
MNNCFNHILIAVNICDSLHIIFAICDSVRNSFDSLYPQLFLVLFPYIHYPLYRISLCASIYLIIGVAIERYLAVCRPHHYREVQTQGSRAFLYILPSILLALLVNTSRFLETESASVCIDFTQCGCNSDHLSSKRIRVYVKPTKLRLNREYIIYYGTWGWVVLTGLIPFLVLVVLNTQIYVALKDLKKRINQSTGNRGVSPTDRLAQPANPLAEALRERRAVQQSKECNLAIVLLATVLMFIVCHLPRYSLFSKQQFSCSLFVIYPGIHCSLINSSRVYCLSSTQVFIVL